MYRMMKVEMKKKLRQDASEVEQPSRSCHSFSTINSMHDFIQRALTEIRRGMTVIVQEQGNATTCLRPHHILQGSRYASRESISTKGRRVVHKP